MGAREMGAREITATLVRTIENRAYEPDFGHRPLCQIRRATSTPINETSRHHHPRRFVEKATKASRIPFAGSWWSDPAMQAIG